MTGLEEFFRNNFTLPDGALYSNLIASAVLGVFALRKYIKHEKKQEAKHEARHRELLNHVAKLHEHIEKGKQYGK